MPTLRRLPLALLAASLLGGWELLRTALTEPGAESLSVQAIERALGERYRLLGPLLNSLLIAVPAALLATGTGGVLAWLAVRTDFPGRSFVMALVARQRLLAMGEPLSNLDAGLREELRGEIRALQQRLGITTVFVTHDQTEALAMSDRIALLHKGRLVELGAPDAVYRQPRTAYAAPFLGKANVLRGTWDGHALRVGAARVAAPALQRVAVCGAAAVMIRPQALRWAPSEEGAAHVRPGTVLLARVLRDHLLGALREYQFEVPALGRELTLVELSGEAPRKGEQTIVLSAADVHPLHEG
ncbi:MAG: hypothetical protein Fur0019_08440 [Tibeticola sp.]